MIGKRLQRLLMPNSSPPDHSCSLQFCLAAADSRRRSQVSAAGLECFGTQYIMERESDPDDALKVA